jgi:thioredoxin 1
MSTFSALSRSLWVATLALTGVWAQALTLAPYSAAAFASAQKAGEPVALHFHATWCPTCAAQTKVFKAMEADPASPQLTVLVADYDKEVALKKQMKVRGQSTLIVFRGMQEKARVIGETQADVLKRTLQSAL